MRSLSRSPLAPLLGLVCALASSTATLAQDRSDAPGSTEAQGPASEGDTPASVPPAGVPPAAAAPNSGAPDGAPANEQPAAPASPEAPPPEATPPEATPPEATPSDVAPALPQVAPAQAPSPAAGPAVESDDESAEERRWVAYVATGVAAASLVTGIVFGVLAQEQFNCARDILACNATRENKVVGTELFDLRADVEQKALLADMGYLFATASGVVAAVGYLRGFLFDAEERAPATAATATPSVRIAGVAP